MFKDLDTILVVIKDKSVRKLLKTCKCFTTTEQGTLYNGGVP